MLIVVLTRLTASREELTMTTSARMELLNSNTLRTLAVTLFNVMLTKMEQLKELVPLTVTLRNSTSENLFCRKTV